MTHNISTNKKKKKIKIDPAINQQFKALHRQLVALSFSQSSHSEAYINTLNRIHELRNQA